ncbi:hypothetical protein, partial [uncultured Campylobacter sp.]|uniref:hypothetical protein n=1 Tax=uncultured Campylobacter sp. TaxID=218934 RepID=UPI00260C1567
NYLNLMIKFQNSPSRITPKFMLCLTVFGAQILLCVMRANSALRQVEFNTQISRRNFTAFRVSRFTAS